MVDGGSEPSGFSPPGDDDESRTDAGGDGSLPGGVRTTDDGRREVVVPDRLYRTVAVFSTLGAIVIVVAGFWFLSAAGTVLQNPTGSLFVGLIRAVARLSAAEVEPYLSVVALVVALVGLLLVAAGGWVFAMGSRFRTEQMGKPKDAADEEFDDG